MEPATAQDKLGFDARKLAFRGLEYWMRERWDGLAIVEEEHLSDGRGVRVVVESFAAKPLSPARDETAPAADDYKPGPARRGRKRGRCSAEIIYLLDQGRPLGVTQIINELADSFNDSTVKRHVTRLHQAGALVREADGRYRVPEDDE